MTDYFLLSKCAELVYILKARHRGRGNAALRLPFDFAQGAAQQPHPEIPKPRDLEIHIEV